MTVASIAFLLLFAGACVAVVAAARRWTLRHPPPPMRPDALRARLARHDRPTRAQRVAAWMLWLAFLVPGLLLLALAKSMEGRLVGAWLLAWFGVPRILSVLSRRTGRMQAARERALTASEAFWSQPDAEEQARVMRRGRFGL
jgi:hypothetical protein